MIFSLRSRHYPLRGYQKWGKHCPSCNVKEFPRSVALSRSQPKLNGVYPGLRYILHPRLMEICWAVFAWSCKRTDTSATIRLCKWPQILTTRRGVNKVFSCKKINHQRRRNMSVPNTMFWIGSSLIKGNKKNFQKTKQNCGLAGK